MSIDTLVLDCVRKGSSYSEKGKSVSIAKRSDESVLLFHTDNAAARSVLGIARSCDVTFLYMRHLSRPVLLFCELKGRNVADAAEQIESTLVAIRGIIQRTIRRDFPRNGDVRAVVVRSGSAPNNQSAIQERFWRRTGVRLQFARERADLRQFVVP
jgi:hypothetical protein